MQASHSTREVAVGNRAIGVYCRGKLSEKGGRGCTSWRDYTHEFGFVSISAVAGWSSSMVNLHFIAASRVER